MAKRSKSNSRRRVVSYNANPRLPVSVPSFQRITLSPLLSVEDRRTFHPDGDFRPARFVSGQPYVSTTVVNRNRPSSSNNYRFGTKVHSQTKGLLAFEAPEKVTICIRRQRRKEVLFAKRKAGRTGQKKPRRNWMSAISCRR